MTFRTYVINLDGSHERLALISSQLEMQGIPYERIAAFDGRALSLHEFPNYDDKAARAFMGRPMRGGEVGCYLSHLKALQAFLESGEEVCLILEDDATLASGIRQVIEGIIAWTAAQQLDWDVVNLGAERLKYTKLLHDFGTVSLLHSFYFPMRATGMLWSRCGAADFLRLYSKVTCPVDNQYRIWQSHVGRGLAVHPWVVPPSGSASDIEAGAGPRNEGDRSLFYGLIKQKRIWCCKLQAAINMRRSNTLNPRRQVS